MKGRDAGPKYPSWLNPAVVATACWWTDQANERVLTLELLNGTQVELREQEAHHVVAELTRGGDLEAPAAEPAGCGRRAA